MSERAPDEVPLRDLYLTFRAGLPLIVAVAVLAGTAAFLLTITRARSYTATAVVQVMPTVVTTGQYTDLTLSSPVGLDQDSYRALAFSREVLANATERYAGAVAELSSLEQPDGDSLTVEHLEGSAKLTMAPSAQLARGQQVGQHSFSAATPEGAAAGANAWAHATAAAARELLSRPVRGALAAAEEEQAIRRSALDASAEAWAEFLARDRRDELRAALAEPGSAAEQAGLRAELANLEAEAGRLNSSQLAADLAYQRSAAALAALELQGYVLAESASLAVAAGAPLDPDGRNVVTFTLAAALVAGLLATLVVFLRKAVSEP